MYLIDGDVFVVNVIFEIKEVNFDCFVFILFKGDVVVYWGYFVVLVVVN